MDFIDALEIVVDLAAKQNFQPDNDPQEVAQQLRAINTLFVLREELIELRVAERKRA